MKDDQTFCNFHFHNFFLTRINRCCNTDHNDYNLTKARDGGMQCSRCTTCRTFALRHMIDLEISVLVKFIICNLFYALLYPPQTKFWGVYRNHPVCLSVRLSVQSKLNLGYNFSTFRDKAFILHMLVPCDKTFLSVPKNLTLWPWPWLLTYFWKKLNLGYNFWTKRDKAFILQVCIPCGKSFLSIPRILTLWQWPWLLTYFRKNLTLTITFEPKVIGL